MDFRRTGTSACGNPCTTGYARPELVKLQYRNVMASSRLCSEGNALLAQCARLGLKGIACNQTRLIAKLVVEYRWPSICPNRPYEWPV